jgi:hypothetical protein
MFEAHPHRDRLCSRAPGWCLMRFQQHPHPALRRAMRQAKTSGAGQGKNSNPTAFHMQRMRNHTGAPPQVPHSMENEKMRAGTNAFVRRPRRWALLPPIAMVGVFASFTSAFADQGSNQATDYALSWRAVGGHHSGPYARGGPIYVPRHRHYR